MMSGLSRFGRYNDIAALAMALMFMLILMVRGVGAPVQFTMDGPLASLTAVSCNAGERSA